MQSVNGIEQHLPDAATDTTAEGKDRRPVAHNGHAESYASAGVWGAVVGLSQNEQVR